MNKVVVDVEKFLRGLDYDAVVDEVSYRGDYLVVEWGHDGIKCVDIWLTQDGSITTYIEAEEEDEVSYQDELFMAVYTSTYSSLRLNEVDHVPVPLRDLFIHEALSK